MSARAEQLLKDLVRSLREMETEGALTLTWSEVQRAEEWYLDQGYAELETVELTVAVQCVCPGCFIEHQPYRCTTAPAAPFDDYGWRVQLVHTMYASLWPITPIDHPDGLEVRDLVESFVGIIAEPEGRMTLAGLCPACIDAGTINPWNPPVGGAA